MIETSNIYNILNYVLPIMNQCFIQINTAYIKSFMKSQKYLKKGVRVGIGVLFFVNFGNQKKIRVYHFKYKILKVKILPRNYFDFLQI